MAKLITTIFASSGDKTYPPLTSTDGSVNLTNGYTDQYEIDLASGDPTAKAVERDVMNGLFSWLFENQSFDQAHGVAPWFSTYTGGYPLNALVADNSTGTWQIYRSLVDSNTAITTATASWEVLLTQTEILARIPFALGGASGSANGALTSGTSLNSWAYSQGTWVVPTDAIAASLVNAPSARQGVLIARNTTTQYNPTTTANGGSFFQMYFDANGYSYIRFFGVASGGSTAAWSAWRTIAFLDSPAFTGTPTAPTAAFGTNTTQLATMAAVYAATQAFGLGSTATVFVSSLDSITQTGFYRYNSSSTTNPLSGAGGALIHNAYSSTNATQFAITLAGTSTTLNSRLFTRVLMTSGTWTAWQELATLASPTFTGTPAAPTAAAGTNTTQIASTAFVDAAVKGRNQQFTASGSFTVPAGITTVYLSGCGAGGGGGAGGGAGSDQVGSGGGGGGAGKPAIKTPITVTPGDTITVTIGTGGTAGSASSTGGNGGAGGAGGNTLFGSLLTLTGGSGGGGGINAATGNSAGAKGGTGYPAGAYGMDSTNGNASGMGGIGGNGPFGGSGSGGRGASGSAISATAGYGYGTGGGGGGGAYNSSAGGVGGAGTAGMPGFLLVEW